MIKMLSLKMSMYVSRLDSYGSELIRNSTIIHMLQKCKINGTLNPSMKMIVRQKLTLLPMKINGIKMPTLADLLRNFSSLS